MEKSMVVGHWWDRHARILRIGFAIPVRRPLRVMFRRLHPGFFLALGPFYIRRRPA